KDDEGEVISESAIGNRYGFTGREYDGETGLYHYRARSYNPEVGRFMQRDPVGYAAGINQYTYCLNSPTNWVDPSGLYVMIGSRPVFFNGIPTGGYHTVIIIRPDDQSFFENHPELINRFYINSDGDLEATLSAERQGDYLVATPNHSDDRPERLENWQVVDGKKDSSGKAADTEFILSLFAAADQYQNNLPYDPTPIGGWGYYNSNSYVYGILSAAGVDYIPNLPGVEFGADVPIPLEPIVIYPQPRIYQE
ncbi:MAG: RHS repeat-associated core domain-containing protein, partial [Candidatus Omnitrophica bacterium]|nr:RHS repeat-associated core domain-containing protein [Candidatus Omnitrophota bacterium]